MLQKFIQRSWGPAHMNQSMELAVVREALQSRLLVELMGNAMHKELVLKGGMAMRAVHGSVRYTKDIDLDADLKYSKGRVQGIVKRSIERAVSSGLIANAKVTEPKQTETTLRWKIVGTFEDMRLQVGTSVEKWLKAATGSSRTELLSTTPTPKRLGAEP